MKALSVLVFTIFLFTAVLHSQGQQTEPAGDASSVISGNSTSRFEDGCYYIDNELFGCIKTHVLSCDGAWYFQLIASLTTSSKYVMAEGFVYNGQDFNQCYSLENGDCFCLTFVDNVVGEDYASTVAKIDPQCQGIDHELGAARFTGPVCGQRGYYYFPCDYDIIVDYAASDMIFPTSTSMLDEIIDYYMQHSGTVDYSTALRQQNQCVYLKVPLDLALNYYSSDYASQLYVELFCPSVIMDTCAGHALIESKQGVVLQRDPLSGFGGYSCVGIHNANVCVGATIVESGPNYIITDLTVSLNNFGGPLATTEVHLAYNYPSCSKTSESCHDYQVDPSIFSDLLSWLSLDTSADIVQPGHHNGGGGHHNKSPSSDKNHNKSPSSNKHNKSPSPSSKHHNKSSSGSDDGGNGWVAGIVVPLAVFFLAVAVVAFVVIIKIRQQRKGKETVYSMMINEEDNEL